MKRQFITKLSLSLTLFFSCLGLLYITNISFAENTNKGGEAPLAPATEVKRSYPALSEDLIYKLQGANFEAYSLTADKIALIQQPHHPFVLLNKYNYLPEDFVPQGLVLPQIAYSFQGANERKMLLPEAAAAVEQLVADAAKEGKIFAGVSAYRSIAYQKEVYARNVKKYGQSHADRYSAVSRFSEHHSGLCIDISSPSVKYGLVERLGEQPEGIWLAANAHRYGFVIRYPKGKEAITGYAYEPWHIRYLGVELAGYLYENNLCYEEFIALVQSGELVIPQKPLAAFADRDILKNHEAEAALELLVTKGGVEPDAEGLLQPEQPITRQEFAAAALRWLEATESRQSPSATLAGISIEVSALTEKWQAMGAAEQSELLRRAALLGIPPFSEQPQDYALPICREEAALILAAIAQNVFAEKQSESGDLQGYFTDAFTLRESPYRQAILNMTEAGVLSNEEFQPFAPEQPVTRAEAAKLLARLFQPELRKQSAKLSLEKLSDETDDYQSKAICLFNNKTKTFVWQKNEAMRLSPASLTKMMTVYVALQHISDLKQQVSISSAYRSRILRYGANIAGFYANEKVAYEDLLYAALLASGAEAAGTLAIRLAGREEVFIGWMNEKAAEWGLRDTQFQTVEGLDAEGQYTTAADMVVFLEKALQDERFYQIFTTATHTTGKTSRHSQGIKLTSTVMGSILPNEEKGFRIIGGKSGTTREAGLCWATLAVKEEVPYILVTLGAPLDNIHKPTMTQKADALKIYQRISVPKQQEKDGQENK